MWGIEGIFRAGQWPLHGRELLAGRSHSPLLSGSYFILQYRTEKMEIEFDETDVKKLNQQ